MKAKKPNPESVTSLETGGVGWRRKVRPTLQLRECVKGPSFCSDHELYISQAEIKICIKWSEVGGGLPSWQFKKGGKLKRGREGGEVVTGWKGTGCVEWWCSDSSGAAEGEGRRLFLPLQTSCPANSPIVVINTCYFPLSPFQSIDKSGVRPARTMALSSLPSDVGWIATSLVVGMVQEELLGDMWD